MYPLPFRSIDLKQRRSTSRRWRVMYVRGLASAPCFWRLLSHACSFSSSTRRDASLREWMRCASVLFTAIFADGGARAASPFGSAASGRTVARLSLRLSLMEVKF